LTKNSGWIDSILTHPYAANNPHLLSNLNLTAFSCLAKMKQEQGIESYREMGAFLLNGITQYNQGFVWFGTDAGPT
jgi:hypothetical protein